MPPHPAGPAESPVLRTLRRLDSTLNARLLGALELAVGDLRVEGVPAGLTAGIPAAPHGHQSAITFSGDHAELANAVTLLDQLRWGATTVVVELVRALGTHPTIAALFDPPPARLEPPTDVPLSTTPATPAGAAAESAVAARHGAAYLALGVATAAAVLAELPLPAAVPWAPAIIGVGLGAGAGVLAETPMPADYAAAALAKRRAEYILPRRSFSQVEPVEHCFGLVEDHLPGPAPAAFAGNGLVSVVPGGALIRTGTAEAAVSVSLEILGGPPPEVEVAGWDEVVEVSWTAVNGSAAVQGRAPNSARNLFPGAGAGLAPPWPGEFRLRVHAAGRDDAEDPDTAGDARHGDGESYHLVVWSAPAGPEVVHHASDRLGHRLRGQPEPPPRATPEKAYRWVRRSSLVEAATITVVRGTTDTAAVVRAFGADPAAPRLLREVHGTYDPAVYAVAVLAVDGAVVAIEDNGFEGSRPETLRALSQYGRVGSMFWNVNALTQLSLAEGGEILARFEPGFERTALPAAVVPFFDGLVLTGFRDKIAKCLVVVERFTGLPVRPEHLARIEKAGIAYVIREM
ncbi:hypothetical protein I6A84_03075 [Frankia sp. CNm7]|uniref:Uncharacterized protein n=1 Tax=Frankia nepalensis TaxID=1836974 RepID=A0A937RII1_9ACTN|nr:DUF6461 domain-containing protein [Frankia nepalensis]MBL7501418.1 hypothetical protein [Frankia nepalensis]MBL7510019.1 hypothetical protein [Frankia nepalensis]MBL7517129.1 hypothetical protein [Frankia nepalensis]MBL7627969.1 hypothetical protein [Frankia nepalensis]